MNLGKRIVSAVFCAAMVFGCTAVPVYAEDTEVTGTQKVYIVGDDWGPAVSKTIVTLDTEIDGSSLSAKNFTVTEKKEATDWSNGGAKIESTATRTITGVYLSDAKGNKSGASKGKIVTVEMYISPSQGSPFRYVLDTGFNKWCEPYHLTVKGTAKSGGKDVTITSDQDIDLKDDDNWYSEPAKSFNVSLTHTGTSGRTLQYGEYRPTADTKKNALVIWLHGAGEGQNVLNPDIENDVYVDILGNEVTALAGSEFQSLMGGAYVITPQAPTMWMDTDGQGHYGDGSKLSYYHQDLWELIQDYVKDNSDIDTNRIIIGGCSNGGYMTMEMILNHPGYFYKAFPICEAFADSAITDAQIKALAESRTQVWMTWADADTTVDPETHEIPTYKRFLDAHVDVHKSEWAKVEDLTGRFKNEDGSNYTYAGHWSWIYFDNNADTCDVCGENEWTWLAEKPGSMYRLYNPNSGEHFYTASGYEKEHLVSLGWKYEGVGWVAPSSGDPVYRLYNKNGSEHHYTMDVNEKDGLVAKGWSYEGIGWYSDTNKEVGVWRQYNPNAFANNHNYTVSVTEKNTLIGLGWKDENIGWYGINY